MAQLCVMRWWSSLHMKLQGVSKKLPFVVLFKLDHHISVAISNAHQLFGQNRWAIWSCFGDKKVVKIETTWDELFSLSLGKKRKKNSLLNTNIPLISGICGLRNHFWPLESRFLMRKSEKKGRYSKRSWFPILIF